MNLVHSSLALFLTLHFVPTLAHAFPTPGDQAVYDISMGGKLNGTETDAVTSVDTAHDQFGVRQSIGLNGGQSQVQNGFKSISTENMFMSLSSSASVCGRAASGQTTATYETLSVVGQMMNTCHIHETQATPDGTTQIVDVWFADVPFGIAKGTTQNSDPNNNFTMTLTSFIRH